MKCGEIQPIKGVCANKACSVDIISRYFCLECKFFDDDITKSIHHCDDCGVCRVGRGIGI